MIVEVNDIAGKAKYDDGEHRLDNPECENNVDHGGFWCFGFLDER